MRSFAILALESLLVAISPPARGAIAEYAVRDVQSLPARASDAELLRAFSPVIVAAGAEESHNRIGAPVLRRGSLGSLSVVVDPNSPVLYSEVRPDIVGQLLVLQLVYRMHFERIPLRFSRYFFEAHDNAGLLVIVTLDARDLKPLFLTTVHGCGCYSAVLPTRAVPRDALPPDWPMDEVVLYGQRLPANLDPPSPGARPRIELEAHSHRVTDARFAMPPVDESLVPLSLVPMSNLRDMLIAGDADGARGSVFHDAGPLRGHMRGAWNPFEGLTVFGIVALDPLVGMDKDFGDPAVTGAVFYTMLAPWRQSASRLDRFDRLLKNLGYRTEAID